MTPDDALPDPSSPRPPLPPPRPTGVVNIGLRAGLAIAGSLVVVFALIALVRVASDVMVRIGIGVLLALAFDPVVGALQRRTRLPRRVSVALVVGGVIGAFVVLIAVLGPKAVHQAERFAQDLPQTTRQLYDLPFVGPALRRQNAAERIQQWAADLPTKIDGKTMADITRRVVGGLASTTTVFLVTISVLIDGEALVRRIRSLVPREQRPLADEIGRTLYRVIGRYFAGSLLVASISATYVLTLSLIFQVPLAPLAAVWMLVVDLIPQIGGFLGGAMLVTLAATRGVGIAVVVLILYILYLNVQNHVIGPTVIGESVNLLPPTTMVAALIGAAAGGIPGALVATPLVGAAKRLYLDRWAPPGAAAARGARKPRGLRRLLRRE